MMYVACTLLSLLVSGAHAFVDGRSAKFFSKPVFAPGQLADLANLIPDDSTPALRTCYERVELKDELLASIWGVALGKKVPAAAQIGGWEHEHHDTIPGQAEWVKGTVNILYVSAGDEPSKFVVIDEETKEEFSALIEPGLVVEYDNERYAHRVDGAASATRKFLGPAIHGSELGPIGDAGDIINVGSCDSIVPYTKEMCDAHTPMVGEVLEEEMEEVVFGSCNWVPCGEEGGVDEEAGEANEPPGVPDPDSRRNLRFGAHTEDLVQFAPQFCCVLDPTTLDSEGGGLAGEPQGMS